ncbi:hypothetical protein A9Q84_18440 [Halobacteriovorax marinus]|uniref:Uncharacterized protein n=1 Tax=Halobacteriovorax marinus TaxID=97084 RepID=A0A1Y5F2K1_9BACT|nr:hypothetical protein A9Q84_18440 [Halobacteriovorax marinus]
MFDDLKEKMEGLVSTIRSKLPGGNSSDEEFEDDDEFEVEEGEFEDRTEEINVKDKLKPKAKSESNDEDEEFEDEDEEDEEDEDDDEEAAKKKKKQKIIRLGIVGLLVVLGVDTFLGGDEELVQQKPVTRKRKARKKKTPAQLAASKRRRLKKLAAKKAAAANKAAGKEDVAKDAPKKMAKDMPKAVEVKEVPPVEPVLKAVQVKEPEPAPKEIMIDNALSLKTDPAPAPAMDAAMGESPSEKIGQDKDLSQALDNLAKESDESKMIKSVVKEKLTYQEPPNYRNTGRGLAYNCTGKHWACVDQESYLNCKKNNDWSKQNSKSPECYPSNVYRSFIDCRTVQVDNINTLAETRFCK